MILFPAIDLKDGQCVRLKLGEMSQATVFNADPAAQAREFERQGFSWLHIVDLNGAFAGKPVNGAAVEAILAAVSMPVQLGGGIRDLATIEAWLGKGIAPRHPRHGGGARSRHWCGRPAGGFRAASRSASTPRAARSRSRAGRRRASWRAIDLARRFEDAGVAAIIYTDIERDGVLKGLNLPATAELARARRSR